MRPIFLTGRFSTVELFSVCLFGVAIVCKIGGPQHSVKQFPNCLTGAPVQKPCFQAFPEAALSNNSIDLWLINCELGQ
jgi:hypothetical protein